MPIRSMMTAVPRSGVSGLGLERIVRPTVFARLAVAATVAMTWGAASTAADEPVFSGPQAGERLAALEVIGVYDERTGKTFDPVSEADDGPVVLVFVHRVTRPGIALTRTLTEYSRSLSDPKVAGVSPPTSEELIKMAYPNGNPMRMRGRPGRRPAPQSPADAGAPKRDDSSNR